MFSNLKFKFVCAWLGIQRTGTALGGVALTLLLSACLSDTTQRDTRTLNTTPSAHRFEF